MKISRLATQPPGLLVGTRKLATAPTAIMAVGGRGRGAGEVVGVGVGLVMAVAKTISLSQNQINQINLTQSIKI